MHTGEAAQLEARASHVLARCCVGNVWMPAIVFHARPCSPWPEPMASLRACLSNRVTLGAKSGQRSLALQAQPPHFSRAQHPLGHPAPFLPCSIAAHTTCQRRVMKVCIVPGSMYVDCWPGRYR